MSSPKSCHKGAAGPEVRLQCGKWRPDPQCGKWRPDTIKKYVLRTEVGARTYRVDYDRELNEEQKAVVLAGGGPILVIAGAWSGKPCTLVHRVARLLAPASAPSRITR